MDQSLEQMCDEYRQYTQSLQLENIIQFLGYDKDKSAEPFFFLLQPFLVAYCRIVLYHNFNSQLGIDPACFDEDSYLSAKEIYARLNSFEKDIAEDIIKAVVEDYHDAFALLDLYEQRREKDFIERFINFENATEISQMFVRYFNVYETDMRTKSMKDIVRNIESMSDEEFEKVENFNEVILGKLNDLQTNAADSKFLSLLSRIFECLVNEDWLNALKAEGELFRIMYKEYVGISNQLSDSEKAAINTIISQPQFTKFVQVQIKQAELDMNPHAYMDSDFQKKCVVCDSRLYDLVHKELYECQTDFQDKRVCQNVYKKLRAFSKIEWVKGWELLTDAKLAEYMKSYIGCDKDRSSWAKAKNNPYYTDKDVDVLVKDLRAKAIMFLKPQTTPNTLNAKNDKADKIGKTDKLT